MFSKFLESDWNFPEGLESQPVVPQTQRVSMNRENQLLVTNELVEVQDFRKITGHLHTV